MRITLISAWQNTKKNNEDLAITPYLSLVLPNPNTYKTYGIGICWIYFAVCIAISFKSPKEASRFIWLNEI